MLTLFLLCLPLVLIFLYWNYKEFEPTLHNTIVVFVSDLDQGILESGEDYLKRCQEEYNKKIIKAALSIIKASTEGN